MLGADYDNTLALGFVDIAHGALLRRRLSPSGRVFP